MVKVNPVNVCFGPEKYLRNEYIGQLLNELVEPEQREFGVSRYDLAETPLEAVLEDAETAPFFVPRKVILASNAVFLTGAKESGKIEHKVDRFAAYLKSPAEYSVLVFTVEADKLDERKKIVKQLKENKWLHSFSALSAEELAKWVERRAEKLQFRFAPGALEPFLLYCGGQMEVLAAEMEKLSLYTGAGGVVTAELVDQLVVRSTEQNIFLLIEDIVQLRMERAFAILYELLKQKEEPIKIVMLMARQFRIILQVKELSAQGYSHQQIAGQIGLHPFPVKIAADQGRRYSSARLAQILSKLADLDFQIKSGGIDKVLGLELAMLEIGR
ncbi:DNA polymerase III subunit delta [Paenibacillus aurantius]|uniref:DNA polymerase III subunit delta n=1 Tax=Paenibacillus aurantius TaxID=2918900 RepID=A0AA96RHJ4_9BACL|nr:DNA polymerase III subunit delta [Paenibacillus aurantius]WNQ13423.1 DNA polymerase III subunit delta [Paenibacillus aurantius]